MKFSNPIVDAIQYVELAPRMAGLYLDLALVLATRWDGDC